MADVMIEPCVGNPSAPEIKRQVKALSTGLPQDEYCSQIRIT
jgi:hypothetical protein